MPRLLLFHFTESVKTFLLNQREKCNGIMMSTAHLNEHIVPKTSYLWMLSGGPCGSSVVIFSLQKDQDYVQTKICLFPHIKRYQFQRRK